LSPEISASMLSEVAWPTLLVLLLEDIGDGMALSRR